MEDLTVKAVIGADSAENTFASLAQSDSGVSILTIFSNVGPALLLVLVLILLMLWVMKRSGLTKFTSNLLTVRANYSVTSKERILVVEIDSKLLVVGVTQQQMTLLHTIDEDSAKLLLVKKDQRTQFNQTKNTFSQLLQNALKRGK